MPRKSVVTSSSKRRVFSQEFKQEAVQMLLDGHTASSIVERLGISGTNLLYRWKNQQLASSGPITSAMDSKLRDLENELRRVERERDILKKSFIHCRPERVADVYAIAEAVTQEEIPTQTHVVSLFVLLPTRFAPPIKSVSHRRHKGTKIKWQ
jgi:transposase-like protein